MSSPSRDPDRLTFGGKLSVKQIIAGYGQLAIAGLFMWLLYRHGTTSFLGILYGAFLVLNALFLVCVAFLNLFASGGTIFNARTRRVTQWGLFAFWRNKSTYPFEDLKHVRIVARSVEKKGTVYFVEVIGRAPDVTLSVATASGFQKAYATAEQVARFVGLDLMDETTDVPEYRQAGRLDESIPAHAARTGGRIELPPLPVDSRISFTFHADTLSIRLPPPSLRAPHVAGYVASILSVAGAAALGVYVVEHADNGDALDWAARGLPGLLLGTCGVILWIVIRQMVTKSWLVEVSPRELAVKPIGFMAGKECRIPADRLEDLGIVRQVVYSEDPDSRKVASRGKKHVVARSDDAQACFGEGLSDAELAWLDAVIMKTLTLEAPGA